MGILGQTNYSKSVKGYAKNQHTDELSIDFNCVRPVSAKILTFINPPYRSIEMKLYSIFFYLMRDCPGSFALGFKEI